uniref:Putative steroid reductase required for elongation of the very long chain fatty acids n=2 Tax=Ixodes ricinus TaxID=34613 RepID=V5HCU2_IXORI
MYVGLAAFLFAELGNLSIHIALRNLRPPGTKERKIPVATANPFTWLFGVVSCPNYTYEVMAWLSFTVMTQCVPAGLFTLAGFYQMAVWALGKHRNYKKEFPNYPKSRKAIVPFVL